jgi:FKBP-type peptidyl-prolyl cis-trans isomerase FkpA
MRRSLTILAVALIALSACSREQPSGAQTTAAAAPVTELQRIELHVAPGEGISQGQQAAVHYTGWLYDPSARDNKGKKFDSSRDRGQPFRFVLGNGQVIKGWDEGVQGMRVGSQRRLIVPSDLGYGARGSRGVIPPNAALVFDIELLAIEQPDS